MSNKTLGLLFSLCLVVGQTLAATEEAWAKIQLSSHELCVDDSLDVVIELHYPAEYRVDRDSFFRGLPLWSSTNPDEPLVLSYEEWDTPRFEHQWVDQRVKLRLEPRQAGTGLVGFLPLRLLGAAEVREVTTSLQQVVVTLPEVVPKGLARADLLPFDELPLLDASPFSQHPSTVLAERQREAIMALGASPAWPWKWVGTGALLSSIMIGFWMGRRHFTRGQQDQLLDPVGQALQALALLEEEALPHKGKGDVFYVRLTSIVRRFLEQSFRLRAPELTTEEFLEGAARCDAIDPTLRSLLADFLCRADLVKFARLFPAPTDCAEALATARKVVLVGQNDSRSELAKGDDHRKAPFGPN